MNLQGRVERLEQERQQRVDAIEARMFAVVRGTPGIEALAAMGAWGLLGADPEPMDDGARSVCAMEPAAFYDLYAECVTVSLAAVTDEELAVCGYADRAVILADLERYRAEMIAQIAECQAGAVA